MTKKLTKMIETWEGRKRITNIADCVVCKSRLWVFDSGSSGDPRGSIKQENNYCPLEADEFDMVGEEVPACFRCMNESRSYKAALNIAMSRWKRKVLMDEGGNE